MKGYLPRHVLVKYCVSAPHEILYKGIWARGKYYSPRATYVWSKPCQSAIFSVVHKHHGVRYYSIYRDGSKKKWLPHCMCTK